MSVFPCTAWSPTFLLQPLVFYVLLAMGFGACLFLFVTLKAEIHKMLRRRPEEQQKVQILSSALDQARLAVERLEADLREVERQTGMMVPPAPTRSGLNLSKRTQVLRMHRAGQDGTTIATALALPRAEVDLLIKVHRIVLDQI